MTLSESAAAPADEVVLEAVGLTKHFPVRKRLRDLFSRTPAVVHAVDDVSFALHRGRVTALVGESGSGKSTVARLLAQIYPRTAGDIRLHGTSTRVRGGRPFRSYVRRVQLILQDPFASLNPVHTVRYHLTRSLRIHRNAGRSAEDLDKALANLLTRVSLAPPERYLDAFPHELSGGQRQRVAIARALGADPEVLLADEPVSMLDVSIRLGVLNLLQDLKERLNLAILYITHDIASARYFADETIVMYAGRMVEGGDSETVTQNPAHPYTRLLTESAPDPERITGDGAGAGIDEAAGKDRGQGEPPSLISPPAGCRFHPRCPHAMRRCTADVPPRLTVGDRPGHWTACWLYDPATVAADAPGSAAPDADPAVPPPPALVEREDTATLGEAR
ncbi:dipeptide/oligopeptide/nickel ABC transporter ATP-binding protein [Micromonospora globispora]|uniref:Dipeptide/oligopeptide/nickel ABC transporter ATP-binding protein n=2 Tax=Micromonospora globispora TaxID=1450148 RepID=A0A317KF47_9ACTN|nr:dipeptide/oligopeptide/nickel ABC transporter ATP-binding protein [Micromonospora globispora]RQW83781.1 dipeptide/oligopeptide/nickel ABC transporter ATP-binding protein [Micromonospora globispora]